MAADLGICFVFYWCSCEKGCFPSSGLAGTERALCFKKIQFCRAFLEASLYVLLMLQCAPLILKAHHKYFSHFSSKMPQIAHLFKGRVPGWTWCSQPSYSVKEEKNLKIVKRQSEWTDDIWGYKIPLFGFWLSTSRARRHVDLFCGQQSSVQTSFLV